MYLGFFCVDEDDTGTDSVSGCESGDCLNVEDEWNVDDDLSQFTLDNVEPLNISRDVLVFLHIQKTVRLSK